MKNGNQENHASGAKNASEVFEEEQHPENHVVGARNLKEVFEEETQSRKSCY